MSSEPRDVRPGPASPAPAELPSQAELTRLPGMGRPFAREDLQGDDDRYNGIVPSPSLGLLPVSAGALLASGT